MSAFFGNMLIALRTGISATTLSAVANATTSSLTASVSGGRGTYTYSWVLSGVGCTITSPTAATTTFTGSSVTGNTSVYCAITDTITGNTLNTPTCDITWTAIPTPQNVVISGGPVTFNGAARAYTLTGTPASPAPSGTPSSFVDAGTYVYPTNISITPGSGYTLGSVTGSFTISPATISGTTTNPTLTFNGSQQSAVVITSVSPAGATYTGSLTASGTNAGTYTSSITGTGNYTGSVSGGTLTISRLSISSMSFTLNGASFTGAQSRTAGTSYTIAVSSVIPSGASYSPTSLTASTTGTYSLTSSGTGNYQGSFTSPVLTLTAPVVVSGSINETSRINYYTAQLTATLTGATATGYSWSRVSGLSITISPGSASNPVTVQAPSSQAAPGTSTVVRCIISYSGGSVTASRTVQWGFE
jgi:hypothetical protein